MGPVVTIGDCIIDAVEVPGEPPLLSPGGAGLNLAVGIARLGLPSILLTRVGMDRDGCRLMRHLRDENVRLLNTPNVDFTGAALTSRVNGEPRFRFSPPMYRRRLGFTPAVRQAIAEAAAVAVNSFPFEDRRQAGVLAAALGGARGPVVVDPNARPTLIDDVDAYRAGVERALAVAALVKLSDEDAVLLYGTDGEAAIARLFACGIATVLLTRGSRGASLFTRAGLALDVPASRRDQPIVDTTGAGDATLASVLAWIVERGLPAGEAAWRACVVRAMDIAAATCRSLGGGRVP